MGIHLGGGYLAYYLLKQTQASGRKLQGAWSVKSKCSMYLLVFPYLLTRIWTGLLGLGFFMPLSSLVKMVAAVQEASSRYLLDID